MPHPESEKEIRGFLGRVQYISRFVAKLTMICKPIFKKLKVGEHVMWEDQCPAMFEKIKEVLSSPPVLSPPVVGLSLSLYLTVTDTAMRAMLTQTVNKEERAIYYISKRLLDYEVNYTPLEKTCLSLVWATKKLRHYMLSYSGRAVADFLADNPIEETEVMDTWSFPDENVVHVKNEIWDLYFDGASSYMGYGVGILLISSTGEHVLVSIKLDFNVTNNAAEYEACLLGLRSALDLGVKKLLVHGYSSLVINQVGGSWKTKSQSLALYQTRIEELEKYFEDIRYVHLPREENKFADVLSKLAALINIPDHIGSMPICVERRSSPAYVNVIDDAEEGEIEPWYTSILKFKETGEYPLDLDTRGKRALRMLSAQFIKTDDGQLYKKTAQGVLLRCIDNPTAKKIMEEVHDVTAILRKMSDNYREWPEKIPFALWGYRTSIRTATGATPYYLVYGMEAVQLVEPSLRILLESQVPEADWVQGRYDSLVMLDERRLNALYHVQCYQKRIERAFNKKVKPRGISEGDLVLKSVTTLLPIDPRGKFKLNWADPYLVKKILSGGDVRLTDLDGNDFTNPTNLDELKKYYP
ncbi:uncharacterized protein LOC141630523 [Silene latifolia]|uniref:uncharacterized protein LOC141630523 n=1 Tax=Silene latifolia TaxID=37657 RepID=UPI003D77D8A9